MWSIFHIYYRYLCVWKNPLVEIPIPYWYQPVENKVRKRRHLRDPRSDRTVECGDPFKKEFKKSKKLSHSVDTRSIVILEHVGQFQVRRVSKAGADSKWRQSVFSRWPPRSKRRSAMTVTAAACSCVNVELCTGNDLCSVNVLPDDEVRALSEYFQGNYQSSLDISRGTMTCLIIIRLLSRRRKANLTSTYFLLSSSHREYQS